MNERNFCYWLQGFFEIAYKPAEGLSPEQTTMIQEHLKLVFQKMTPEPVTQLCGTPNQEEILIKWLDNCPSC